MTRPPRQDQSWMHRSQGFAGRKIIEPPPPTAAEKTLAEQLAKVHAALSTNEAMPFTRVPGWRGPDEVNVFDPVGNKKVTTWNTLDSIFGMSLRDRAFKEAAAEEYNIKEKAVLQFFMGPQTLEQPQHSILHRAMTELDLTFAKNGQLVDNLPPEINQLHSLLIQHDWAAVFSPQEINEWRLPYPITAFEFQFSGGWRVIAACGEADGGQIANLTVVMRTPKILPNNRSAWFTHSKVPIVKLYANRWESDDPLLKFESNVSRFYQTLFNQIRATAIMLDAEVATTEPIRAPYKSNRPPAGGLLPQISHHIVVLRRRPRANGLPPALPSDRRRPRLHFRRGHWRHFPSHKTWINWQLVGNPDLGFVDKIYKL